MELNGQQTKQPLRTGSKTANHIRPALRQAAQETKPLVKKTDLRARAQLRCPACGRSTEMPATRCGHCGADFLTGERRPGFRIFRNLAFKLMAYALFIAAAGSIVYVGWRIHTYDPTPVVITQANNFQRLAEENPQLLQPYVMAMKIRHTIEHANDGLYSRQEIIRQLSSVDGKPDPNELSAEALRNLTPGQRAKMLKELSVIISGRDNQSGSDEFVSTTPGMRKSMLESLERQSKDSTGSKSR